MNYGNEKALKKKERERRKRGIFAKRIHFHPWQEVSKSLVKLR